MAPATSCASSTPPALACEAAGRRSGGLLGGVMLLVAVVLLVALLVVLLLVARMMSVMLVMGRRHHRLHQGGRQGERGQGSEQVANPHVGVSFLREETPGRGGRLKRALPACPEHRRGLPGPAP